MVSREVIALVSWTKSTPDEKTSDKPKQEGSKDPWVSDFINEGDAAHGPIKTEPVGIHHKPTVQGVDILIVDCLSIDISDVVDSMKARCNMGKVKRVGTNPL